ncbi:MAG: FUSC family protein [Actinomycetota bacterium]|nr:FUSC family protein [Actinomycetota bacterium]
MTAWAPALLNRFQAAFGRLGTEWSQVAQKALAAGMAYWIASSLLGHEDPAFASIAALISLAVTTGKEGSQVVELVFGVACGLTVADLLLSLIGSGALQIALVVGLATGLVTFFGGGALSITEAGVSALLMVILASPSSGMSGDRFIEALVGAGIALGLRAIIPSNPRRSVSQAAHPIFGEFVGVLENIYEALYTADLEQADDALRKSRRMDARVGGFREALDAGYGTVRLSPPRRRALGHLGFYARAADQLDLAVRDSRGLARAAVAMVRAGGGSLEPLAESVLKLAQAVDALGVYLDSPDHPLDTREYALKAAGDATVVLHARNDLETNMLVGQIRSTALDLLQASGMDYTTALQEIDYAVLRSSGEHSNPKAASVTTA